jgi:hypothetical protein
MSLKRCLFVCFVVVSFGLFNLVSPETGDLHKVIDILLGVK